MRSRGKIFATLIHEQVYEGIDTGYYSLSDVPEKYQASTIAAWHDKYSYPLPGEAA